MNGEHPLMRVVAALRPYAWLAYPCPTTDVLDRDTAPFITT